MTLIEKAYQFAIKERSKNWKEYPGGATNPNIALAYRSVDGLGDPNKLDDSAIAWCAVFVNYCLQAVGGKGNRRANAQSFLTWGKACKPKQGCIVVLKRGKEAWQGHVAFYVKREGDHIYCLGGNQSNDLNVSKYKLEDVLGYRTSLDDNKIDSEL